jgi:hypothetical protein
MFYVGSGKKIAAINYNHQFVGGASAPNRAAANFKELLFDISNKNLRPMDYQNLVEINISVTVLAFRTLIFIKEVFP